MDNPRIRILIVDDHPMYLEGLATTLAVEPDMEIVASAMNGHDAVKLFGEKQPDVTIMDLTLTPEMSGIEAISAIREEFPEARIIALSMHKGEDVIYRALQVGAATCLLKEVLADELIRIIRKVHSGERPIPSDLAKKLKARMKRPSLTIREMEVLKLMAEGLRNKEIARALAIGEQTAQTHVKSILAKLGVSDRTQAVTVAVRKGIIDIGS